MKSSLLNISTSGPSASTDRDDTGRNRVLATSRGVETIRVDGLASPQWIVPWFEGNNNEIAYLSALITNNHLMMGLLSTKCAILAGQGLALFRRHVVDGTVMREEVPFYEQPEIQDFFEFNSLNEVVYQHFFTQQWCGNFFSELIFSKGKEKVTTIATQSPEYVRAIDPGDAVDVREYYISGNWNRVKHRASRQVIRAWRKDLLFSRSGSRNTQGAPRKVLWHGKIRTPNFPVYSPAPFMGARKMIELSNEFGYLHLGELANRLGIRGHVKVSRRYISQLTQQMNPKTNQKYTEAEVREKLAEEFTTFFTSPENAGKTLITAMDRDVQNREVPDFVIEKTDMAPSDDTYVKLNPVANSAVTSSMSVDPSLAGLILDGKLSSGSEKRNAWNIEVMKAYSLRRLALAPIRFIHRWNGWPRDLEWGFRDQALVTTDRAADGIADSPTDDLTIDPFNSNENE